MELDKQLQAQDCASKNYQQAQIMFPPLLKHVRRNFVLVPFQYH